MIEFYKNKTVLVTGHTGFKGTWLAKMLVALGAKVIGYSLNPITSPNAYELSGLDDEIISVISDIRDYDTLKSVISKYRPEIVFHLAAQAIVRESYSNPRETYETNVMGTVNILEAIRNNDCVKSVINVTTDKVYKNLEWEWGYREIDELNGFDPYSNSKSCSELVTSSYINSFFNHSDISISTVRAGNVIGGGDFSIDRIIPDAIRAILDKRKIIIRNPNSIRPYQYVLEPVYFYLFVAYKQYQDRKYAGHYNIGPMDSDQVTTISLVEEFFKKIDYKNGIEVKKMDNLHEANLLKLDCSKIKKVFNYIQTTNVSYALDRIVEYTNTLKSNKNMIPSLMEKEIMLFLQKTSY